VARDRGGESVGAGRTPDPRTGAENDDPAPRWQPRQRTGRGSRGAGCAARGAGAIEAGGGQAGQGVALARRLRVGVCGAGYFGRLHALKLARHPRAVLAGVCDLHHARAAAVAAETGAPALDWPGLLRACSAVVIAAPAAAHHALAAAALDAGRHVLVEKPIATTLAAADDLAARAAGRGLVLQVGHLERFSAAFAALTAHLGRPRWIEATRVAPYKPRGTDVSVVLDLMIHDLDLALVLAGGEPVQVEAVGTAVVGPAADAAQARLRFANGMLAVLTASRVAAATERRLAAYAPGAVARADFLARSLTCIRQGAGAPVADLPGFGAETHAWDEHDSLAAEHDAFLAAVLDGAQVAVDAAAGRRALAAALAVEAAIREAGSAAIEQA